MKTLLLVLALVSTNLQAQAVKPEDIIPDIGDYDIVKGYPCQPPGYMATVMCLHIKKGEQEYLSVHDIQTKEPLEIRDTKRVVWKKGWLRA